MPNTAHPIPSSLLIKNGVLISLYPQLCTAFSVHPETYVSKLLLYFCNCIKPDIEHSDSIFYNTATDSAAHTDAESSAP
jgi:hypothetical protein